MLKLNMLYYKHINPSTLEFVIFYKNRTWGFLFCTSIALEKALSYNNREVKNKNRKVETTCKVTLNLVLQRLVC